MRSQGQLIKGSVPNHWAEQNGCCFRAGKVIQNYTTHIDAGEGGNLFYHLTSKTIARKCSQKTQQSEGKTICTLMLFLRLTSLSSQEIIAKFIICTYIQDIVVRCLNFDKAIVLIIYNPRSPCLPISKHKILSSKEIVLSTER